MVTNVLTAQDGGYWLVRQLSLVTGVGVGSHRSQGAYLLCDFRTWVRVKESWSLNEATRLVKFSCVPLVVSTWGLKRREKNHNQRRAGETRLNPGLVGPFARPQA